MARWTARVYIYAKGCIHTSHDTHQKARGGQRFNDEHLLKCKQVQKGTSAHNDGVSCGEFKNYRTCSRNNSNGFFFKY